MHAKAAVMFKLFRAGSCRRRGHPPGSGEVGLSLLDAKTRCMYDIIPSPTVPEDVRINTDYLAFREQFDDPIIQVKSGSIAANVD